MRPISTDSLFVVVALARAVERTVERVRRGPGVEVARGGPRGAPHALVVPGRRGRRRRARVQVHGGQRPRPDRLLPGPSVGNSYFNTD